MMKSSNLRSILVDVFSKMNIKLYIVAKFFLKYVAILL